MDDKRRKQTNDSDNVRNDSNDRDDSRKSRNDPNEVTDWNKPPRPNKEKDNA